MGRVSSAPVFILCLASGAILAQDDTGSAEPTAEADGTTTTSIFNLPPRTIEEITVVGQRSLARLRLRIDEKSDEIYSFFNDNNSDDRFDIICTRRRPTGSHILNRECEPKFLRDRRVQLTRDYLLGVGIPFDQYDLVGETAGDYEKLQDEMLQMMTENKEFASNLADLADLTANYLAHRRAMFGDD